MPQMVKSRRPWRYYLVMGAVCLGVFAWTDGQVFHNDSTGHGAVQITEQPTGQSAKGSDAAMSNQAMKTLANKLGDVAGLTDLAILPDGSGETGYDVSAMVDVSAMTTETSSVPAAINKDVDAFYRDIYSSGQPIAHGEITFTNDNDIIGTAGLGKQAYAQMATSTMNGDLATALSQATPVENHSTSEEWLQIKNTQ